MANKWNYRHGDILPNGLVINAPNDNVVGNVVYVDQNNPNASDSAPNAGCANVPRITINDSVTLIVADGTYNTNISGWLFHTVIANNKLKVRLITAPEIAENQIFFNIVIDFVKVSSEVGSCRYVGCILNKKTTSSTSSTSNLILKTNTIPSQKSVLISVNALSTNGLHYNCVPPTQTSATGFYNKVFWLGTLNLNTYTSDLNTICAQIDAGTITENQGIAQVETDLGLAVNTLKNNGFRLLNPHFINIAKGNFNIDFLNYDCTAILALRDSWGWIINRGVRCEYPTDFVGASGFGETPNAADGFNGALYSRNIDAAGAITNTAYDTVLVSKKYVLPTAYTLENINFFDKLISTEFKLNATENDGTDTPNCYTYYFIGVKAGVLESVFNSTNNTFSYNAGVLTCDFPRFMWNHTTQLNKDDNTIYGQIENGTFDLDYMRNIFKAGVKEFRLIAVKKGV